MTRDGRRCNLLGTAQLNGYLSLHDLAASPGTDSLQASRLQEAEISNETLPVWWNSNRHAMVRLTYPLAVEKHMEHRVSSTHHRFQNPFSTDHAKWNWKGDFVRDFVRCLHKFWKKRRGVIPGQHITLPSTRTVWRHSGPLHG